MKLNVAPANLPATMTPAEYAALMGAVPVKLVRDTWFSVCLDCGLMASDAIDWWGWRKTEAMHQRGMGHRFQRYGLAKRPC